MAIQKKFGKFPFGTRNKNPIDSAKIKLLYRALVGKGRHFKKVWGENSIFLNRSSRVYFIT